MNTKTCEGRKLDSSDCELLEKELEAPFPIKNATQIYLVSDKSTQGYFLLGDGELKQNLELTARRFGIPNQITTDFDLRILDENHQRESKCCGWSQRIKIHCYDKHYASTLHKVTDIHGLMKDVEEIIKIQGFEIFFGHVENIDREPIPRTLKGFVKIDFRQHAPMSDTGITFAIWGLHPENEKERTVFVVQRFFSPASNRTIEAEGVVRNSFKNLKDSLTGLYYSPKVKDILEGFEL
jgi:hypothetical protein